jgi:hypothetical protein
MVRLPETAVGGLNKLLGGASRKRQRYNWEKTIWLALFAHGPLTTQAISS